MGDAEWAAMMVKGVGLGRTVAVELAVLEEDVVELLGWCLSSPRLVGAAAPRRGRATRTMVERRIL